MSRFPVRRLTRAVAALAALALPRLVAAQQPAAPTGTLVVTVRADSEPLASAIVRAGRVAVRTDEHGVARLVVPAGAAKVIVRRIGFKPDSVNTTVAAGGTAELALELHEAEEELEAMTVLATRSERRLSDEPNRVEVLAGEDIGEKSQMRPQDLTLILSEMGGVRMQQTSGSLGGTRLRINGLRGQYTGFVTDGLPIFGSAPTGFEFVQTAPVDIRAAEVIKGAASALYGPSALGGVLNLVSRRPDDQRELYVNQSSRGGSDLLFWSGTTLHDGWGWSVAADAHRQQAADVDGDRWADIPAFARVTVRPRLYKESPGGGFLLATVGTTLEDRAGGFVDQGPGAYVETLHSTRVDGGLSWRLPLGGTSSLTVKGSGMVGSRQFSFGALPDRQKRQTFFAEASYSTTMDAHQLVLGVAASHDQLDAWNATGNSFRYTVPALFAQHTWAVTSWATTQETVRCDFHNAFGSICTPRLALLLKPEDEWSVRLSGGGGFFAPTALTDEADQVGLRRVNVAALTAERAATLALDVSGTEGPLQMNATFAWSRIDNPSLADTATLPGATAPVLRYRNATAPLETKAVDLALVYEKKPWVTTVFYGYLDGTFTPLGAAVAQRAALQPRHAAGVDVSYEATKQGTWVAVEAFHTGEQAIDFSPYRTTSKPYTLFGILASQRIREGLELFVNGENLFDDRLTGTDPLLLPGVTLTGTPDPLGRRVTSVWGPLEGRVVSLGLRARW
jgi:iron complex outermembrane receptor protein